VAVFDGHSPAGSAFKDIARRLQGETIPFTRYDVAQVGMMSRLMRALGFARV
jgi:septum formation inhibitor-activating ATPase MinD